jgi:hypothetical protein
VNAVATQREMMMPMCDLMITGDDGSSFTMMTEEQQHQQQPPLDNSGGLGIFSITQAASTPKAASQQQQNNNNNTAQQMTQRQSSLSSGGILSDNDADANNNNTDDRGSKIDGSENNDSTSAAQQQSATRAPKTPAARHFYKKDEHVGTGNNKNITLLHSTLTAIPSVPRILALTKQLLQRFPPPQVEKLLFKFLLRECGMHHEGRQLAGPLLSWLFSSLPGEIVLLPKTHLIPRVKSEIQFLLIGQDPEREARFQALKAREQERRKLAAEAARKTRTMMSNFSDEKDESNMYEESGKNDPFISGTKTRGSFFAWHGSGPQNWHSILRNGLKNMSHTHMMTTGALHGGGIYASRSMHIALSYSLQPVAGWRNASVIPHSTGISVISLCEIVDWNGVSVRAPDPRLHPAFRNKRVFRDNVTSQPTDPVQIHADGQIVTVLQDEYLMPRVLVVYTDRTPKNMDSFELEIPEALLSFIENQYNVV